MKVYLTANDIQKLSEGKTFRCEDRLFKPSKKVIEICKSILDKPWLLDACTAVLESNWQVSSIYLQYSRFKRRRKR